MSPSGHTIAVWFNDDTVEIVADGKQDLPGSRRTCRVG